MILCGPCTAGNTFHIARLSIVDVRNRLWRLRLNWSRKFHEIESKTPASLCSSLSSGVSVSHPSYDLAVRSYILHVKARVEDCFSQQQNDIRNVKEEGHKPGDNTSQYSSLINVSKSTVSSHVCSNLRPAFKSVFLQYRNQETWS